MTPGPESCQVYSSYLRGILGLEFERILEFREPLVATEMVSGRLTDADTQYTISQDRTILPSELISGLLA